MLEGRILRIGFVSLLLAVGQGCATSAPVPDAGGADDLGDTVVRAAEDMLGVRYRYGGSSPRGFDCSGLVYYAHRQAGIAVPRTTGAQLRYARPVGRHSLRPGDVLFFELEGRKVSHVGIYAGSGSFIHAPSTGKQVSYATLRSAFWRHRLVGAGRFY